MTSMPIPLALSLLAIIALAECLTVGCIFWGLYFICKIAFRFLKYLWDKLQSAKQIGGVTVEVSDSGSYQVVE